MSILTGSIQLRKGTAAAWTLANPILLNGEEGHETDTGQRKIGDGVTAWNALGYLYLVPSQTGNAGKVLYTDGTNLSWQFAIMS